MADGAAYLLVFDSDFERRDPAARAAIVREREAAAGQTRRAIIAALSGRGGIRPDRRWQPVIDAIQVAARREGGRSEAHGIARLALHVLEVAAREMFRERARWPIGQRPVDSGSIVPALVEFGRRAEAWVRPVEAWLPDPCGERELLLQLARHLFVRWEMPEMFDGVWREAGAGYADFQDWYVSIGAGEGVRAKAPFALTAQQAHFLMLAPDDCVLPHRIHRALAYADVRALGGGHELAVTLCRSKLSDSRLRAPAQRQFWLSVIRFLIETPGYPDRQYEATIDYLDARRFAHLRGREPDQPGLRMSGRTTDKLLREMITWRDIQRLRPQVRQVFAPPAYPGLGGESGWPAKPEAGAPCWRITHLPDSDALCDAAYLMRNCLNRYVERCAYGVSTIWQVWRIGESADPERAVCVEVSGRRVIQARGPANRWPSVEEVQVVKRWARMAGLVLTRDWKGPGR